MLLDDEVTNLEDKQVKDILKDEIDEIIPESEDNIIENYTNRAWNTSTWTNDQVIWYWSWFGACKFKQLDTKSFSRSQYANCKLP